MIMSTRMTGLALSAYNHPTAIQVIDDVKTIAACVKKNRWAAASYKCTNGVASPIRRCKHPPLQSSGAKKA